MNKKRKMKEALRVLELETIPAAIQQATCWFITTFHTQSTQFVERMVSERGCKNRATTWSCANVDGLVCCIIVSKGNFYSLPINAQEHPLYIRLRNQLPAKARINRSD